MRRFLVVQEDNSQDLEQQRRVIKDIIKRLNEMSQHMDDLIAQLGEYHDVQLVDKLDIVNLRNEIEKIRLVVPSLAPENEERFAVIMDLAQRAEKIKVLEKLADDVKELQKQMRNSKTIDTRSFQDQVALLMTRISQMEQGGQSSKLLESFAAHLDQLEKRLDQKPAATGAAGIPQKDLSLLLKKIEQQEKTQQALIETMGELEKIVKELVQGKGKLKSLCGKK